MTRLRDGSLEQEHPRIKKLTLESFVKLKRFLCHKHASNPKALLQEFLAIRNDQEAEGLLDDIVREKLNNCISILRKKVAPNEPPAD